MSKQRPDRQPAALAMSFHKTIFQEFYQVTFYRKRYRDLESSQKGLDSRAIIIMKELIREKCAMINSYGNFVQ